MGFARTGLAGAVVMFASACSVVAICGRTSLVEMQGSFALTAQSGFPATADSLPPAQLQVGTDALYDTNLERRPGVFDDLWSTLIEGSTLPAGRGIAVTLEGRNPDNLQSIARLVVILPTPLRKGRTYPIGRVFPAPFGLQNPDVFGTRYLGSEPLAAAGQAELAMFYGRRVFENGAPLATEIPDFMATTATGSVTVLSDSGRELRLRIDAVVGDSAGRTLRFLGETTTMGNTFANSCTS